MKKTLKNIFSILAVSVLVSCGTKKANDDIVLLTEINMDNQVLNFDKTKMENNARSGKFYSTVDSINQYGVGYSYIIPDSLKDRNLTVYVSGWVREAILPLEGGIAVAIANTKGIASWNVLVNKNKSYNPGEWTEIKDSITYASSVLKDSYSEVSAFAFKTNGGDRLDIDDLKIKYKFSK